MTIAESRKSWMIGGLTSSLVGLGLMVAPTFPHGDAGHSWWSPTLVTDGAFLALPAALAAVAAAVLGFLKWRSAGQRFVWAPAIWSLVSGVLAAVALVMAGALTLWAGLAVAAMVVAAGLWTQTARPALPGALPSGRG